MLFNLALLSTDYMDRSKARYHDHLVDGIALKRAMEEALEVIGPPGLHHLFEDLERHGIAFEKGKICSLKDVCKIMNDLFGGEASGLLMERIYDKLRA